MSPSTQEIKWTKYLGQELNFLDPQRRGQIDKPETGTVSSLLRYENQDCIALKTADGRLVNIPLAVAYQFIWLPVEADQIE